MAEIKPEAVALTGLLTISAYGVFKDVLPPITEVRQAKQNDEAMVSNVRIAEALAVTLTMLAAISVSSITGVGSPIAMGIASSVAIVAFYEYALSK